MRLKRKLFPVLGLMTTVPLLILLFVVVGRVESDLEARAGRELHQTLNRLAQELASLIDTQKSLAKGLARVPAVRDFAAVVGGENYDLFEGRATALAAFFLNYQATVSSIQALRFTDPAGKTLVKVKEGRLVQPKEVDAKGRAIIEDVGDKAFFRTARGQPGDVSMSDFERGKVSGEVEFCPAMIRYSVPILDELDYLLGFLVVNVWGQRIDNTVEVSLGGYPGQVYIVEESDSAERDGIYLYHADADRRFANQIGTPYRLSQELGVPAWRRIKESGEHGTLVTDGGRMLFYRKYAPYADRSTRWLLIIETSRDTVLAPITGLRVSIWTLLGLLLLLSLAAAHWVAARMARPVHELANTITRYADGERSARYNDRRRDEIGLVGKAFNYLSEKLERAEHEREKAEMAAEQSERLAAVGEMAAGIGHEINNPLMNIMSLASLIDKAVDGKDEQVRSDLKALQDEGRRCAGIVQGILNFARANEPSYRSFNMAQLIADTVALLQHRLDGAAIQMDMRLERPLDMEGDPNQLQQVLVNVLLNAIHASPPRSTIAVKAWRQDAGLRIEIHDNGHGISESHVSRVFNPFFTTKDEGEGTGLGLSVSYGIVQRHGGAIAVENGETGGVIVRIALPVTRAARPQDTPVPEYRDAG